MRPKLHTYIFSAVLNVLILTQFLGAQNLPLTASDAENFDWNLPFHKCWEFAFNGAGSSSPVSYNRNLILSPGVEGEISAFDLRQGQFVWQSRLGGEIISDLLIDENKIYLISKIVKDTEEITLIRALSPITGLTLWQKNLILPKNSSKIFLLNNKEYIYVFSNAGSILSLAKKDGAESWSRNINAKITSVPFLSEDKIFVGDETGKLTLLSVSSGNNISSLDFKTAPSGNVLVLRNVIVVGELSGSVSAFRLNDHKLLWKTRTGAQIAGISETGVGDVLVSSNDGFIYLLDAKTGDRRWKKRLAGRPIGKPFISNNFALLQTIDANALPIFETAKGKLVNQIQLQEDQYSVAPAIPMGKTILIPTNQGLQVFSEQPCDAADTIAP